MKVIEEPQLAVKRRLPWLIDAVLYPLSVSGIIHILLFAILLPLSMRLLRATLATFPANFLFIVLNLVLNGYVLFYLCDCVNCSSKGGFRAPSVTVDSYNLDKWDCITKVFLILGCFAVCFWPAGVYHLFTRRIDWAFWLFTAGGSFFLPMALLAGVMFGSFDALNPLVIVRSISKAFVPYCGLVFLFCVVAAVSLLTISNLPRSRFRIFPAYAVCIYFAMVAAHLVGRFYWWHKHQLDWGL